MLSASQLRAQTETEPGWLLLVVQGGKRSNNRDKLKEEKFRLDTRLHSAHNFSL